MTRLAVMTSLNSRVRWSAVNGIVSGVVTAEAAGEWNWLVRLDSGKFVIVNEKSFIDS